MFAEEKKEAVSGMDIVNGEEVTLSFEGSSTVRCVFVEFAGERPSCWKAFGKEYYEENNWVRLSRQGQEACIQELGTAIAKGAVRSFSFSLEPWGEGHYLNADFANGWAAIVYMDDEEQIYYNPYNPLCDAMEFAPVEFEGQTPVPKRFALEDLELAAEIAACFLSSGKLYPKIPWMKS